MSSVNTFSGFYNLPAITITAAQGTAEVIYPVPASGVYGGSLPSPSQIAGNWLVLPALAGDVAVNGVLDGRPFVVNVSGKINNAQSETITIKFYQVTAAGFLAGPTTTSSTGVNSLAVTTALATGATNGKANFSASLFCSWDSASKVLNGNSFNCLMNNTLVANTHVTTPVTALAENDLNFAFTVAAGTTGTGDIIGPLDFSVERY
jgi:hypothetical protein